jgi:DNA-directed RNA polymerase subunit RPC12/RpoP
MMKGKTIILGIVLCTWYSPIVSVLSLLSALKENSSLDMILLPTFNISLYIIGLSLVFYYTKDQMQEPKNIPKKKTEKVSNKTPKVKKEQPKSLTACWKCKMQYSYIKNTNGDTIVQCPNCGNKGLIK